MSVDEKGAIILDEVVEILAEDLPTPGAAEAAARMVLDDRGEGIYTDLIWNLTNLRYEAAEAKKLWKEVLEHKYFVSEKLGRNVGIRIAALDYFANFLKKLARPRVIDPQILERLYSDATIDPLTNLPNRRHYRDRLAAEIHRSRRYRNHFVLGVFDLDDFKALNDREGHTAGDQALVRTAAIVRAALRDSDFCARWGGEEFVILLPETTKRAAVVVAERIRAKVDQELIEEKVTISGGLAAFPSDGENEKSLFEFADRALYRAKSEGKNRISLAPFERRAFPRLDESLSVRITPIAESETSVETKTSNIGGGGIAFFYESPLPITQMVRGEIEISGHTITFIGHVARVEEIAAERFEVGLQFLEIDPIAQDLLLQYTA